MSFQEARMVIARAYRHTEKLLQDNKDKLALVSSANSKCFLLYSRMTRSALLLFFLNHNWRQIVPPVGQCTVGA